jgi:sterol desaturase/sphingolipid hydroxylase (fatty acid hydroxylase superfamily)
MMNVKYEKQDVKGWFLLLDVVVTLVLLTSTILLVYNAYMAGAKLGAGAGSTPDQRGHYWAMMTSVAFLTGSLAYLFGRYFKHRLAEVNNPWV